MRICSIVYASNYGGKVLSHIINVDEHGTQETRTAAGTVIGNFLTNHPISRDLMTPRVSQYLMQLLRSEVTPVVVSTGDSLKMHG